VTAHLDGLNRLNTNSEVGGLIVFGSFLSIASVVLRYLEDSSDDDRGS
jgi:hypothetical protein